MCNTASLKSFMNSAQVDSIFKEPSHVILAYFVFLIPTPRYGNLAAQHIRHVMLKGLLYAWTLLVKIRLIF